jgi:hypothetical protein
LEADRFILGDNDMKRSFFWALALSVGMVCAANASAQVAPARTERLAYFGFGGGITKAQVDCTGTAACDEQDVGWKGFIGYMFSPNIGVEFTGADLGTHIATFDQGGLVKVEFRPSSYALFGVGALPLGERFALFAKAGVAYVESRVTASGAVSGGGKDAETNVAFGLGGTVQVMKGFAVRGEWERYRAKYSNRSGDVDLLSLSLQFQF